MAEFTEDEIRVLMCEFGRDLYDRKLTDTAGGNMSVRVGDLILMTPTRAGNRYHWKLSPDQILALDLSGNKISGKGELSRETAAHIGLLNEFHPDGKAVIHGHTLNALVFCAARKPMPPVLDGSERFGVIQQIEGAPSGSEELAEMIVRAMRPQRDRVRKQAAAVMAPGHGLFVLGSDLHNAFDAVERIDANAYCIVMGMVLTGGGFPPLREMHRG